MSQPVRDTPISTDSTSRQSMSCSVRSAISASTGAWLYRHDGYGLIAMRSVSQRSPRSAAASSGFAFGA